jgi:hypothetical protein
MKQFLFTILVFSFSVFTATAHAESRIQKAYVQLADGVQRYVEYSKPAAGKPWIVFTNGLVYELERWAALDAELRAEGYGIVHYYLRGQDYSLARETEQFQQPLFFKSGLQRQDFAEELNGILDTLKIQDKVTLVGLSYGAHVAADQIIFMAPLVVPLESYELQGAWLDWNLTWVKAVWGNDFYEYAYRQIYGSYLGNGVTNNVPEHLRQIPEIYKESLFHLVRVVRDFDLRSYKFEKLDKKSVYFMLAQEEKPQAFADQVESFEKTSAATVGSLIFFPEASHAIPDSEPHLAAKYLQHIIARDSRLVPGQKYKSTPRGLTNW